MTISKLQTDPRSLAANSRVYDSWGKSQEDGKKVTPEGAPAYCRAWTRASWLDCVTQCVCRLTQTTRKLNHQTPPSKTGANPAVAEEPPPGISLLRRPSGTPRPEHQNGKSHPADFSGPQDRHTCGGQLHYSMQLGKVKDQMRAVPPVSSPAKSRETSPPVKCGEVWPQRWRCPRRLGIIANHKLSFAARSYAVFLRAHVSIWSR